MGSSRKLTITRDYYENHYQTGLCLELKPVKVLLITLSKADSRSTSGPWSAFVQVPCPEPARQRLLDQGYGLTRKHVDFRLWKYTSNCENAWFLITFFWIENMLKRGYASNWNHSGSWLLHWARALVSLRALISFRPTSLSGVWLTKTSRSRTRSHPETCSFSILNPSTLHTKP